MIPFYFQIQPNIYRALYLINLKSVFVAFFPKLQASVVFAFIMSVTLVSGQFLGTFDNSYRFGYDSSASLDDISSGSSFGNFGGSRLRDPRQNRGKFMVYLNSQAQNYVHDLVLCRPFQRIFLNKCVSVFRISQHIFYFVSFSFGNILLCASHFTWCTLKINKSNNNKNKKSTTKTLLRITTHLQ